MNPMSLLADPKTRPIHDWQYRIDMGKQIRTRLLMSMSEDKRYYVRLLAQNLAGSQWTGKETIINRIPIPDDLPGSLFLWFDANDLSAQNKTEFLINPAGTPVDTWKNKARKSDDSEEQEKDLGIPLTSPDSNNPKIVHDGHDAIAVVDFDGNDWLQNEPNSIPTSWRDSGYTAFAVDGYSRS